MCSLNGILNLHSLLLQVWRGDMVLNAISGTSLPLPGNLDCDPRLYPDYRKSSCSIEGVYDVSIVETVLNVLKYDKN